MVEARVTKLTTGSNNFALNLHTKFAESYARDSSYTVSVLSRLRSIPAALDAQKLVITLTDGITQHATHIENIIRLQSILGSDGNEGLTGKAAVSGAAVEDVLRNVSAPRLVSELAVLRKLEWGLRSSITREYSESVSDALNNLKQSVTASTLSTQTKKILRNGFSHMPSTWISLPKPAFFRVMKYRAWTKWQPILTPTWQPSLNFRSA